MADNADRHAGDIDLSDLEFWTAPLDVREQAFAALRAQDPIARMELPPTAFGDSGGYWSLTRHEHVLEASKRADDFCSGRGTNLMDMPPDFLEFFGSMINMDDPKHARLRKIVSRGFTPRKLDEAKAAVERAAAEIVDSIAGKGECDFVTEVAALLPLRVIVDMLGIPRSYEQYIFDHTNRILGASDPEYIPDQSEGAVLTALLGAGQDLANLVRELAEEREKDPRDDLITALATADVDGDKLTPAELGSFFILLVVAGNETTRNAIAHGLVALSDHPDQQAAWQANFDAMAPAAVEEIVRWATPVIHFRRTVTRDGVRIGDHRFDEGDKVALWYCSANRDEAVFKDAHTFDLTRSPNDHVGFGGPGAHFCLGAHLARREMTVMFRELFQRLPDIHAVEAPDRLRSNFINGIKHLKAEFTPVGR